MCRRVQLYNLLVIEIEAANRPPRAVFGVAKFLNALH